MAKPILKRILLKISGESFKGDRDSGIDPKAINYMANEIKTIVKLGIEIGVVVGGGNIWRGAEAEKDGMDRATADYAGMLATIINAVALQDSLERKYSIDTRTQSAITVQQVAEPYIRRRSIRHLEKKRVVVFAAGTGNPHMTTDTTASLRAIEIEAELLLMAKYGVDGVYSEDPRINKNAKKFDKISYQDALTKKLKIMDTTALALCMDNDLPIVVFDMFKKGNLKSIITGNQNGTLLSNNNIF